MWNLFHVCRSVPVLHQLAYIKPNAAELAAIAEAVLQQQPGRRWLLQDPERPGSCRCSACSSSSGGGTMAWTARAQDDRSTSGESAAALPQALQELLPQAAVLLTAGELAPSHNGLR